MANYCRAVTKSPRGTRVKNGNDDGSAEAHLEILHIIRGPFLDPEISIFVKIFLFNLVIQSL
jgi:hypothetical protein